MLVSWKLQNIAEENERNLCKSKIHHVAGSEHPICYSISCPLIGQWIHCTTNGKKSQQASWWKMIGWLENLHKHTKDLEEPIVVNWGRDGRLPLSGFKACDFATVMKPMWCWPWKGHADQWHRINYLEADHTDAVNSVSTKRVRQVHGGKDSLSTKWF